MLALDSWLPIQDASYIERVLLSSLRRLNN